MAEDEGRIAEAAIARALLDELDAAAPVAVLRDTVREALDLSAIVGAYSEPRLSALSAARQGRLLPHPPAAGRRRDQRFASATASAG